MAVPNKLDSVKALRDREPQKWKDAHTGNPRTEDFVRQLAAELHATDPKWGLLGKRGNPNDISDDVLCYRGEGVGHDPTDGNKPITAIDIIRAAGSAFAEPQWQVLNDPVEHAGPGAWVKPAASAPGPTPTPQPPPANTVPFRPYDGDEKWVRVSQVFEADYKEANGHGLDGGCGMWIARTIHDCYMGENAQTPPLTLEASIKKHRAELRAALGLQP